MNKVKFFTDIHLDDLEKSINLFARNHEIIDIAYFYSDDLIEGNRAMILYKE